MSYLGETSRATPADAAIQPDTGLIALMKNSLTLNLKGKPWGTEGKSQITLVPGINLVGVPLKSPSLNRVTDVFHLEGIRGNVTSIIVHDGMTFQVAVQPGDAGDIVITGETALILIAREPAEIPIDGEAWGK